jgi:GNAT superfamily N-acetyltransferase
MNNEYIIHRATMNDASGIQKTLLAAFKPYKDFYNRKAFSDTVLRGEKIRERLNNMRVYVAVDKTGKITATIGWQKIRNEEGHIRGMAVHPQRQGNNSPAKKLLNHVEAEAKSEGCKIMTLDTTQVLLRAHRFYKKNGYKETGKKTYWFGHIIYEFAKEL